MEGQNKCSLQTARMWTQLHGNVLTCGPLVLYQTFYSTLIQQTMAYPISRLHYGLSTGTNWASKGTWENTGSDITKCTFYQDSTIFEWHFNDSIFDGLCKININKAIKGDQVKGLDIEE